ncbi:MAG TPA: hypothetical protein ACFYD6_02925 [Candidatus Brocadiia bacterium]
MFVEINDDKHRCLPVGFLVVKKEKKPLWKRMRHPVPKKVGGPLTTKKGEKGYNRKRMKRELQEELKEFESEGG